MSTETVIRIGNRETMEKRLTEVQGRCSVRWLSAERIMLELCKAEEKLAAMSCNKADFRGTRITIDLWGRMPDSYKWRAEKTVATFERLGATGSWRFVSADRVDCWKKYITPIYSQAIILKQLHRVIIHAPNDLNLCLSSAVQTALAEFQVESNTQTTTTEKL